ncbi:unnamed protein product [Paramecium sonneborni]|uniref:Uncharacterized protein n=1 Tax=Paramecium sonneborni TaxID=65129 RepID=A0A8S1QSC6_9CILI|nr:unnamed protein product [Paramecium sonneborni]
MQLEDQIEQLKQFLENYRVLSAEIDQINDVIKLVFNMLMKAQSLKNYKINQEFLQFQQVKLKVDVQDYMIKKMK